MSAQTRRQRPTSRNDAPARTVESSNLTDGGMSPLESQRLSSAIVNTAPVIVYIYDLENGCNVYANDGLSRVLGYSPEHVQKMDGMLFAKLVHPDDLPRLVAFQNKVRSAPDGAVLEDEHRARHRDGTWHVMHTYESPFSRNAEGSVKLKIGVAIDVTERTKAEDELRKAKERTENILSGITDTYVVFDRELRYTDLNPKAAENVGLKREDLLGKVVWKVFPRMKNSPFHRAALKVLRTQVPIYMEACWSPLMGRWYETHIYPFKGGLSAHFRDVTDRQRLMLSLSHERNLYKDLVDSQPTGVYRVRVLAKRTTGKGERSHALWSRMKFELTSDTFCRLLGVTQAQCKKDVGVISDRIHPEDRTRFLQANTDGIKRLETFKWDGRICRGKAVRWVHFTSVPRPLSNGDVVWTGIVQDITERKRMEDAIRKKEEELAAVVEGSTEPIVLLDTDGRVVRANAAMCKRMGVSPEHLSGRTIFDMLPKAVSRTRRAKFRQALRSGQPTMFEDERAGRTMVQYIHPTKGPAGKVTGCAVLVHDITELKLAEARLKQLNDGLETTVRERTAKLRAMAAELTRAEHRERKRIAHILHEDLQQRLAAIKYKMESLRQAHEGGPAAATEDKLIAELDEAIRITRTLTRRMAPPALYELGLYPSLEWLAHDMEKESGLVIRVTGQPDCQLRSDELQTFAFDAVRELLMNVGKHAGVDSAEIQIRAVGKGRIAIDVIDQGKGCATIHESTPSFGLFSIRERAQAMGADFKIASTSGKGTRATLILPT